MKTINKHELIEVWKQTTSKEVLNDAETLVIGTEDTAEHLFLVLESEKEKFEEFKAEEYGSQDYSNIVEFDRIATIRTSDFIRMIDYFKKNFRVKE